MKPISQERRLPVRLEARISQCAGSETGVPLVA